MKLKVADLFSAYFTLVEIINSKRPLPQVAQYRIARLYAALRPEFETLQAKRNELVEQFGEDQLADGKPTGQKFVAETSPKWSEFVAAWEPVIKESIEVAVEPIPLSCLGSDGAILAQELVSLGELIKDA